MGIQNKKRESGRKRGESQSGSAAAPARPRRVLSGRMIRVGQFAGRGVRDRSVLVSAPASAASGWRGGVSRPVSSAADLYQRQAHALQPIVQFGRFWEGAYKRFWGTKSPSFFDSIRGRYHALWRGWTAEIWWSTKSPRNLRSAARKIYSRFLLKVG